ncbi:MAG: hypothetical protein IKI34_00300 [Eubacterium sp.]|nr:hypothetical protein [Eubacterium sp.]
MKNKTFILLKNLLLSTSRLNYKKYTKDAKKRNKAVGGIIGVIIVYAMLMFYMLSLCVGYGQNGLIGAVPINCALTISLIAFVFTFFKTNGYLFNFKEYDMLMSLPIEAKTVASCKFLYMYIKMLPWYASISVAMLIGYAHYAKPGILVYVLWIILSFILPIIPMIAAAFFGFLIARISTGFKKTNIVQTILSFVFVIFCFSLRFIIENIFRDDKVGQTLESISSITNSAAKYYPPAGWFSNAVINTSFLDVLLLIALSAVLFALVFAIVGKSYRNINSALKSHHAAKKYNMKEQKKRSVENAIAFKEFKRMTGSTTYMVNVGMGEVLAPIFALVCLIFGFDNIISKIFVGAPLTSKMMQPAIPFILYFFIGMMASTVCSPSLEGKNYWILQSLPIDKKTIYKGKMRFNIYLTVPFMTVSVIMLCIGAKTPFINTVLYTVLGILLCIFSTIWGMVCGVKHIKLEWENEVEVIKQGTAVLIYLLPNMFVVMGLCVLTVFLGTRMDHKLIAGIFILITAALCALNYARVMRLAKK